MSYQRHRNQGKRRGIQKEAEGESQTTGRG